MTPNRTRFRRIIATGGGVVSSVADGPDIDTNLEKWSLMHLAQPYYVPLSAAAITEADQNMMLGLYSGLDYS